jgi:Response regulator containing a CheY-like receiver domain and an HTH DNA-binding domain
MQNKTRVVFADDDPVIRENMAELLAHQESLELVAAVAGGSAALAIINAKPVDVVLLDVDMPVLDGIETAQKISDNHPNVKIIMLTAFDKKESLKLSLKAGAQAFLTKDMPIARIVEIIGRVLNGEQLLDPAPTSILIQSYLRDTHKADTELLQKLENLPPRQKDIVDLLVAAQTTTQICDTLSLSERTVRTYISKILQATGCGNRSELALRAVRSQYKNRS